MFNRFNSKIMYYVGLPYYRTERNIYSMTLDTFMQLTVVNILTVVATTGFYLDALAAVSH